MFTGWRRPSYCAGTHRLFGVRFAPRRCSLDADGFDPRMSANIHRPVGQTRRSLILAPVVHLVPSCHLCHTAIVDARLAVLLEILLRLGRPSALEAGLEAAVVQHGWPRRTQLLNAERPVEGPWSPLRLMTVPCSTAARMGIANSRKSSNCAQC
jgi:hypothetical protein